MTTSKRKATATGKEFTTAITTIAFEVCATVLLGGLLGSNTLVSQEAVAQAQPAKQSKFFLALFLPYVEEGSQTSIYAPNMDDNDQTRLRVSDQSTLNPDYIIGSTKPFWIRRSDIQVQ